MARPKYPPEGWSLETDWYMTWFDSPWYALLYQDRDEEEARGFIDQLLAYLATEPGATVLDLACGKGRYARYLASRGFEVTGIDLSVSSIAYARRFERDNLSFFTHDMRMPFRINYFDLILNCFTSFGYFALEKDDLRTLKNVRSGLRARGVFVLDFFNARYVREHLLGDERKTVQGVTFICSKRIEGEAVVKDIRFEAAGKAHFFQERVRLYQPADFDRLFSAAGLRIRNTFGDYHLAPFDEAESPRIILVAEKP